MPERFYAPDPPVDRNIQLAGDEAHHLTRVRRVGVGDLVELFDGQGHSYPARVTQVRRTVVELIAESEPTAEPVPFPALTLACAVPKGERFDWLVEKATELGVMRLVPLITERSVVVPGAAKVARMNRLIIEACKQCGRNRLMRLEDPARWADVVRSEQADVRLLAHPDIDRESGWLVGAAVKTISLAIGPEGGWTEGEVETATALGWKPVQLGRTILRIETAALAAAAILMCGPGSRP